MRRLQWSRHFPAVFARSGYFGGRRPRRCSVRCTMRVWVACNSTTSYRHRPLPRSAGRCRSFSLRSTGTHRTARPPSGGEPMRSWSTLPYPVPDRRGSGQGSSDPLAPYESCLRVDLDLTTWPRGLRPCARGGWMRAASSRTRRAARIMTRFAASSQPRGLPRVL